MSSLNPRSSLFCWQVFPLQFLSPVLTWPEGKDPRDCNWGARQRDRPEYMPAASTKQKVIFRAEEILMVFGIGPAGVLRDIMYR
ncbi:hypothetical protein MFRU_003g01100 [Monilinia fructicola]|nr:hypothetical protein MFRU_003g01100 [Monilinia fructicola]